MRAATIIITALPFPAIVLLAVLLGKLRRHDHPDRPCEWYLAAWAVFAMARLIVVAGWPHHPWWVWYPALGVLLAGGAVILASRIRAHPETLFSPATIAWVRGWSAKVRGR